uniref:Uncharacterized protein n=1 Tax=Mesocestoides corti TaxID=53468 RepID=A0A5K3EZ55_MESCO
MSPAVRIVNSPLISTIDYSGSSSPLGLDVSTSMTHTSEVEIHMRKPHTRHNDTNVVDL